jgi:mono/diheme cytochrome c family protein
MPEPVFESLLVVIALTLMIMGAGALIGYVVVNHKPYQGTGSPQAAQSEKPGIGGGRIGGAAANGGAAPTKQPAATTQAPQGNAFAAGKQVFASAGCGSCHTLKDANATGTVGPNLDQLKPDVQTVAKQVIHGGGPMPAYQGRLSPQQIQAVAKYVAAVAGKS